MSVERSPNSSTAPTGSVRDDRRTAGRGAHRSVRGRPIRLGIVGTLLASLAAAILAACGGSSSSSEPSLPPLFTVDDLGAGWFAEDPGDVPLLPGSVAPPCPFDAPIPDIEISAADSMEFGNDERQLGVNHTLVDLNGDPDSATAVFETWAAMDCGGSDFEVVPLDGLSDGMVGFELKALSGTFAQAVIVEVQGSVISFVIVSGNGAEPALIARRLAD